MAAKGKSSSNERKAGKIAGFRLSAQLAFLTILGAQILLWYGAGVMVFGKLSPRVFFATAKGVVTAATLFWGAIFVSAAVFGPVYCGWLCAFGTYQDFVARVLARFGGGGRRRERPSFTNCLPGPVRRVIPYAKYALLAFLLSRTAVDVLRNPPKTVVINLAAPPPLQGMLNLTTLLYLGFTPVLIYLLGKRSWCRYVCPFGAALSLLSLLAPYRVRSRGRCLNCKACDRACPVEIPVSEHVASYRAVRSGRCVNCFQCIDACPAGILGYRAGGGPAECATKPRGMYPCRTSAPYR